MPGRRHGDCPTNGKFPDFVSLTVRKEPRRKRRNYCGLASIAERTHHNGYITSRVMKNATLKTMKRKSHKCWYLA